MNTVQAQLIKPVQADGNFATILAVRLLLNPGNSLRENNHPPQQLEAEKQKTNRRAQPAFCVSNLLDIVGGPGS